MRENLIGYLIDALEPAERAEVDKSLLHDANLQRELNQLRASLIPLAADAGHYDAPAGLVARCCEYVQSRAEVMPAALSPVGSAATVAPRRWSKLDLSVAGGIAIAVAVLIVPAILQSRAAAQKIACANNLTDVGRELARYSDRNDGKFPLTPVNDRLNAAGMWAPTLVSQGYLPRENAVVCPSTALADDPKFRVPNIDELCAMSDAQLAAILPRIAGSYGYTLGYREGNSYKPHRRHNGGRATFAIASDAPGEDQTSSPNHGGCGQNVLFEDGHVKYLNTCKPEGTDDDFFRNAQGAVAPGLHEHDSVIVPGHVRMK